MVSAILVKQRTHIGRQVQRGKKILVQPPAANRVDRMFTHPSRPHGKQSKRSGVLQLLLLQKCTLLARSREIVERDFRVAKLCRPLRRRNDGSSCVYQFQEVELVTLRQGPGKIEISGGISGSAG